MKTNVYGVGLVGSHIVLLLLANGTPPEAIRIVDLRPPTRPELSAPPASTVNFQQTDITSAEAVLKAFEAPWPSSVSSLPLTVFHTAALIQYSERAELLYHRCSKVNVVGTAHVVTAAKAVGAGVLIYTSSSIIAVKPVGWFFPPWSRGPHNYTQVINEQDFFEPLRSRDLMATNYAMSKAVAERLVCEADDKNGMRTGAIRPGNAVYGSQGDYALGVLLEKGEVPTFVAPNVQNWVHAGSVALAQIKYEDVCLGPYADRSAGRPFSVTDNGPPLRFKDLYLIFMTIRTAGFIVTYPPPLLLLIIAYCIETWSVVVNRFPILQRFLAEPKGDISLLQPGTFVSASNSIVDDSAARKSPEEGGIGYRAACTTLEGVCLQVVGWNDLVAKTERDGVKKQ